MAQFTPNKPVTTKTPQVQVDTQGMKPGVYQFQLVVVDNLGRESAPTTISIKIAKGGILRPSDVPLSLPPTKPTEVKPTETKPTRPKSVPKPKGNVQ